MQQQGCRPQVSGIVTTIEHLLLLLLLLLLCLTLLLPAAPASCLGTPLAGTSRSHRAHSGRLLLLLPPLPAASPAAADLRWPAADTAAQQQYLKLFGDLSHLPRVSGMS
jgi:hypothetical protein